MIDGMPGRRIVGLDLARFVAIVGMLATHVWLYADLATGEQAWFSGQFRGRASALFAVLAGVGIVLSTRTPLRQGKRMSARWMVVGRGAALIVIGLTLDLLQPPMLVILVSYGVMFWVLAVALTWRRRVLVVVGVVSVVAAPVLAYFVALWSRIGDVTEADNPSWFNLADPLPLLRGLLFTGIYPVTIWLVYGVAGMLLGRSLLRAQSVPELRVVAVRLLAIGAGVWALGVVAATVAHHALGGIYAVVIDRGRIGRPLGDTPIYLLGAGPHNGTTFDLLLTIGFAVTTIALLVLLGTVLSPFALRMLSPVTGAGSAPLTVYSAHVVLVSSVVILLTGKPYGALTDRDWAAIGTPWWISSGVFFAANVVLALVIGATLVLLARRGPLEAFVIWAGRKTARVDGSENSAMLLRSNPDRQTR
ncbi:heparan-alpha-glucosaminide N-acetyltransferase domain-containing protein [Cryobacterium algoritolerans]|nr:heparan-alpha-glucosaminide N-acetyltransferase domain-containing protein [Cryobacterium algoritolerans]